MSDQEGVKTLLPEGEYPGKIVDIEPHDTLSGNSVVKIHLGVKGFHLVVYQICGPLLRDMVIKHKDQYIGKDVMTKIAHQDWLDETTFHNVKAMALL